MSYYASKKVMKQATLKTSKSERNYMCCCVTEFIKLISSCFRCSQFQEADWKNVDGSSFHECYSLAIVSTRTSRVFSSVQNYTLGRVSFAPQERHAN